MKSRQGDFQLEGLFHDLQVNAKATNWNPIAEPGADPRHETWKLG